MTAQDGTPGQLGPYRLLQRLGEGGMGVVYLAVDPGQCRVAVKALRPAVAADPNARRRLAREVETMRRVRSPFVAEVIDADVTSDPPYIVTRYVEGRTLDEVVSEGGPLAGSQLARLASGLALALSAVHAAGVVHRDLKPGNVMIAGGEPVVIDFGIAQVPDSTRLTQTGMFMGTPGYLAPEVIEGKPSGPASDVHSWGATVAFAATGRPPFGTGAFETIFYRIVNGQPDLAGFPAPLLSLVSQALSRDPARRPETADLCLRTAGLNPSSLVPAAAAAGAATFAAPGTVADRPVRAPTAVAGAAAGSAGALAGVGAARSVPDSYGDVLPPVRYAPPGPPGAPPARQANGTAPAAASRSPAGPLLVAASVATLIAVSVISPVAGAAAAVAMLILLRAGDRAADRMTRRRSRRGSRPSDPLLAAALFPPALAWSVVRSLLLLPLALIAAGIVAVVTIVASPHDPLPAVLPMACAYAAGALVACYGAGPGSAGSRRAIRSFFDVVAGTPLRATAAVVVVAGVFFAAVAVAASHAPFFWPFGSLTGWLSHLNVVHLLVHRIRARVLRGAGGLSG
jgi:predicted Ser/Thr protein kinase